MGAYGRATTAGPLLDPSVREALAGRHILIAEDNEVNQQVAREMLEQVGMRVTIAENGRRAIEILTAGEAVFDAVLMDLQMPEVRSEEHTSELQSLMRISYAVFCLKKKDKK